MLIWDPALLAWHSFVQISPFLCWQFNSESAWFLHRLRASSLTFYWRVEWSCPQKKAETLSWDLRLEHDLFLWTSAVNTFVQMYLSHLPKMWISSNRLLSLKVYFLLITVAWFEGVLAFYASRKWFEKASRFSQMVSVINHNSELTHALFATFRLFFSSCFWPEIVKHSSNSVDTVQTLKK